eukprot:10932919-Ditylum_brightwellii.AAC.1
MERPIMSRAGRNGGDRMRLVLWALKTSKSKWRCQWQGALKQKDQTILVEVYLFTSIVKMRGLPQPKIVTTHCQKAH